MRVQHNIAAMNSYRNYNVNTRAINKNLEKLSSGYKINRAGDDAAGLAVSEKMRAQITGIETAQKNSKDAISLVQTAEGALTEVHSMLNRMYELTQQASNDTYQATDRSKLQSEVDEILAEIDRIAGSVNFNGTNLLDGTFSSKQFKIGDAAGETLSLTINSAKVAGLGLTGFKISGANGSAISSKVDTIKTAISTVSTIRSKLGATQNRLEHTINNLSVMQENLQDAESTIRDTDVANEMMKYTKNSILVQSAQAMLAQANQQPQGVLQLLQ
jgi:flagellin